MVDCNMRSLILKILAIIRFDRLLYLFNRTPRILFWHSVDKKIDSLVEAEGISLKKFETQLDYLEKHYEIISCSEYNRRFENNSFTNREVVLTFDDGYKNNLTVLAPLMKKRNIPFLIFISTNHIDTGRIFPTSLIRLIVFGSSLSKISIPFLNINQELNESSDRAELAKKLSVIFKTRPIEEVDIIYNQLMSNISNEDFIKLREKYSSIIPMTWDDVKMISTYGGEIGCHCLDHICCHSQQDISEVKRQIVESKDIIEKRLGIPCNYFAYPNGSFTEQSNKIVNEAGFIMGFTTKPHKIDLTIDKAMVPRVCAPSDFNLFKIKINIFPR